MSTYVSGTNKLEKLNIVFSGRIKIGDHKYDLYDIDKSEYPDAHIKCDDILIKAKCNKAIIVPKYTPIPRSSNLCILRYHDYIIISYNADGNLEFNNAKSICSPLIYNICEYPNEYPCFSRLIYAGFPIKDLMKVSLNNIQPMKNIYHIRLIENKINVLSSINIDWKIPYYSDTHEIRASYIPMLKHGYTNVYLISKFNDKLDLAITLKRPESFIYNTFVYGHATIDMNNSIIDVISQLSKYKDNRKWIGFEDVKILVQ